MAIFEGTANDDNLIGGTGADTLYGRAGKDWLDGGLGADRMEGGLGDDGYAVGDAGDVVFEALGEGYDYVVAYLGYYALPDNVETLHAGPGITGFHGVGNGLFNQIFGTSGSDVLNGGGGGDMLFGEAGDDTYHIDHANDLASEKADSGYDTVIVSGVGSYTLAANVERMQYSGGSAFSATGNALGNDITTGTGNDTLDGGAGNDVMRGGKGDDIYYLVDAGDVAVEQVNEGTDTIRTSLAQASIGNHIENMTFIGQGDFFGQGNALANRIEGGAGNDTLYGLEGNDTLIGLGGDDGYWAENSGDTIIEAVGGGWDRVWVTAPSYTLPDNVENLYVYTASGVHAVGNALNNHLSGHDGNDILNGAGGTDMMFGGKGDDVYVVEQVDDYVQEADNEGFDTVNYYLNGSYMLKAGFEKLVYLGGSFPFIANGNGLDNVLITGAGGDQLNGWGGADTMEGKGGNDTYYVDNNGDKVIEAAGEGTDSVHVTIDSYVLPGNVENLYREGSILPFSGTGNALANRIEGSYGNDTLDGGAGADTLVGSSGNDVYILDDAGDRVTEHGGGGVDEIRTALGSRTDYAAMFTLPEHVENLTGTSAAGQGVFGNAHNNVITMGAGGDLIVLQDGGNDVVNGGGGDDYVFYGSALTGMDINDGGAGYDTLGLLGDLSHEFSAQNLTNFEKLAVYSSGGGAAMPNDYSLVMADANVAAGKNLMVVAQSLNAEESLTFDGSAERNGSYNVRGGKGADSIATGSGADQLWGNLGADQLRGGGGKDAFEYYAAAESTMQARDTILDFELGDKINLKAIDSDANAANGNSKFVFLGSNWFNGKAGELRAWQTAEGWLVEADINGDGSADLAIGVITANGHILTASDFYL